MLWRGCGRSCDYVKSLAIWKVSGSNSITIMMIGGEWGGGGDVMVGGEGGGR